MHPLLQHLKEIRQKKGMSMYRLAKITGLNNGYVYEIDKGAANPSLKVLTKIAKALDVEIAIVDKS